MTWTTWSEQYGEKDANAFMDPTQINRHFGLPYQNVFSLALNENGEANIHEGRKQARSHYLANLLTYRYIKTNWEGAWIWDERYRFLGEPRNTSMRYAQREFIRHFGEELACEIAMLAKSAGLNPGNKTEGRPDLAVFFPHDEVPWRFIELKLPDKGDKVNDRQARWLDLFTSHLGPGSAVVFEWRAV